MQPLTGREIASHVQGMIHPKYQVHGYSVDLTVRAVAAVDPVGRVDFGGSEYTPAGKMPVDAQRRNPDDKYRWWDLGRGAYFVEFNEAVELGPDEIGLLEPDERLVRAGATHTSIYLRGRMAPLEMLVEVQAMRVQVKQNARISRLRIFRFAAGESLAAVKVAGQAKKAGRKKRK